MMVGVVATVAIASLLAEAKNPPGRTKSIRWTSLRAGTLYSSQTPSCAKVVEVMVVN